MTMRAHRKFRIFVRLSLIALLVEIGCLTSQANAALVAHWSFDTDFTDSTGGHNGTLVDGGTANSGIDTVDKKFGAGSVDISADGAPGVDYVDIASPVTLVHDADGFTFAFWLKKRNNDNQAMIATTTSSSTRVKPAGFAVSFDLLHKCREAAATFFLLGREARR